jgi:hypothetical protein
VLVVVSRVVDTKGRRMSDAVTSFILMVRWGGSWRQLSESEMRGGEPS